MRRTCSLLVIGNFVVACTPCDRWEEVLATDANGRSVVSEFEACTGIGTTLAASIELRSASGHATTIFKYEPSGGMERL
jgi:hypothetical protein